MMETEYIRTETTDLNRTDLDGKESNLSRNPKDLIFVGEEPTELTLEEKVDELLVEINGKGRFSCFSFLTIIFGMNATGYFFYILSYLIMKPKY